MVWPRSVAIGLGFKSTSNAAQLEFELLVHGRHRKLQVVQVEGDVATQAEQLLVCLTSLRLLIGVSEEVKRSCTALGLTTVLLAVLV